MRIRASLLLALIWALPVRTPAQSSKTLSLSHPLDQAPVRIVRVMQGGTEVKSDGVQFRNKGAWRAAIDGGEDDSLKNISLVIENVSPKKIVYINVQSVLYDSAKWREEKRGSIGTTFNHIGMRPESALYSYRLGHRLHADAGPPLELAPGQTLILPLEDGDYYPKLKASIEEKEGAISTVAASVASIGEIFFEDGTQWQPDKYLRPDMDEPGHWVTISREDWSSAKDHEGKP
jgi:hypothetical protein